MVSRLVADDIHHGGAGPASVVQIGEPVRQARAAMQQRRGRFARHACIAVGGTGHHTLEQAEHAAHPRHAVERRDKMQFAGSGIRETGIDTALQEGVDQTFSTVQQSLLGRQFFRSFDNVQILILALRVAVVSGWAVLHEEAIWFPKTIGITPSRFMEHRIPSGIFRQVVSVNDPSI